MAYLVVGERLPRVEGVAKATGEAKFTADLSLPRMLYGNILKALEEKSPKKQTY